tara:strand:+ start:230 stop:793 length:564 start_codon:yes stop_codon:yes gene_type:complete
VLVALALAAALALWQYNARDVSGATAGGSGAYYIKFDGIDGEVADKDHKNWSNLSSFSQALSKNQSGKTGAMRRRGDVAFEEIVLVRELDKSSPKLAHAVAKGEVFPKVEIHVTASYTDSGRVTYYAYELKNVQMLSYSISGNSDVDSVPEEQVKLNFEEIKVTYTEVDSAGKSKGNIEYTWKVEEN